MAESVGLVIPAYDPDPERLVGYIDALQAVVNPAVILVELDDPGPGVCDRLSGTCARVNTWPSRRGKGAAITAGFEALDTDRLAFADADGSTPAPSMAAVVAALDEADLAVGSRRHPDARVESHQTVLRRYLGHAFAWTARRLLPVALYDYQCGAKALRREAWQVLRPYVSEAGFAWDIELVGYAAALDRTVVEVPVSWQDAPGSTVDPVRTTASLARALFSIRGRLELLDRGEPVVDGSLVASNRRGPVSPDDPTGARP